MKWIEPVLLNPCYHVHVKIVPYQNFVNIRKLIPADIRRNYSMTRLFVIREVLRNGNI